MPLLKKIPIDQNGYAYLWEVTESESFLASRIVLTDHCQGRMQGMKSELHRRAFLSVRHLMALAGYLDTDLYYDTHGKPHLQDGTFISISHSFNVTALVVHKNIPVGIDVEMQRDKILRIAHKFTILSAFSLQQIPLLTHIWACKESIYKIASTPGLSFLEHIEVWPAADAFYGRIPTTLSEQPQKILVYDYFELKPFEVLNYAGVIGLRIAAASVREDQAIKSLAQAIKNSTIY